ncbi:MAG: hypothetical protein A2Y62_11180 [Candidatus Fischerbacteria bacterium RBG_13_37_8]|uniref:Uncharacterized protein n=1 Tax=Candidatus Fischerbacteria bacterium RBG_13_37_8 TaxID=1817863 RepID=A0A1F5VWJ4_9BACT|nr:MAG: hypothetical protein A2Y62_11180 [Candidatus Fischerbacteria bacterium RBG_13_37_8]
MLINRFSLKVQNFFWAFNQGLVCHETKSSCFVPVCVALLLFFLIPKVFGNSMQLQARYVRIHCTIDLNELQKCASEQCASSPKIKTLGGSYYIDYMHVGAGYIDIKTIEGSRRRYGMSDTAGILIKKICTPDVTPVLKYIKYHEFRYDYNDIYFAKENIPDARKNDITISLGGNWYMVSHYQYLTDDTNLQYNKIMQSLRNISPVAPAVLNYPSQAFVVARSKEEFLKGIGIYYLGNSDWQWKLMKEAVIKKARQEWIDSLGIDFSKKMAIAVFNKGNTESLAIEVGISNIVEEGTEIHVYYYATGISGKEATRSLSSHYDIVVCDRREAPVVFYENLQRKGSLPAYVPPAIEHSPDQPEAKKNPTKDTQLASQLEGPEAVSIESLIMNLEGNDYEAREQAAEKLKQRSDAKTIGMVIALMAKEKCKQGLCVQILLER